MCIDADIYKLHSRCDSEMVAEGRHFEEFPRDIRRCKMYVKMKDWKMREANVVGDISIFIYTRGNSLCYTDEGRLLA